MEMNAGNNLVSIFFKIVTLFMWRLFDDGDRWILTGKIMDDIYFSSKCVKIN
jgi:hypothetical protein